jgi:hypothetical protein
MYVAPEEADGTIGFDCDVTDVLCLAQVVANGETYIFTVLCYFKHLVMQ